MPTEGVKKANQTRVQKVKAIHEKKEQERKGNHQVLKAEYMKERDSAVVADILAKAKSFAAYHITVGRDGVGANKEGEVIYFTNEKRVSEFDRSAGIQEIIDYIERMIALPTPEEISPLETDIAAEDDEENPALA